MPIEGHAIECIGVVPEQRRAANQLIGNVLTEFSFQNGKHVVANPHPRKATVFVVRIFEWSDTELGERGPYGLAINVEQWSLPDSVTHPHAGQRSRSRAPQESQEDRLSLIVSRMREPDCRRVDFLGCVEQRRAARDPRSILKSTLAVRHVDMGLDHRVEPELPALFSRPSRYLRRSALQSVIDDDCAELQARFGLLGCGRSQSQ